MHTFICQYRIENDVKMNELRECSQEQVVDNNGRGKL